MPNSEQDSLLNKDRNKSVKKAPEALSATCTVPQGYRYARGLRKLNHKLCGAIIGVAGHFKSILNFLILPNG